MYIKHLRITLFMIFLSACGGPTSHGITEITPTQITPSMNTKPPLTDPTNLDPSDLDPTATRMVQKAREHLMKKFNVSNDQITVFSVQRVTWPDASLGCPQPENLYAQVLTPGFQIMFEASGKTFSYHTDESDIVVLCDIRPPNEIFLPP